MSLTLTEFEIGVAVSYQSRFSAWIFIPSMKQEGHNSEWKKQGLITHSMDQERLKRCISYLHIQIEWDIHV